MTDNTSEPMKVTLLDSIGLVYDFVQHNTPPNGEERQLCLCQGCNMVRAMAHDDQHFWPLSRATVTLARSGLTREEFMERLIVDARRFAGVW